MEKKNSFTDHIINNLRKIMNDKGLTQATMAEYANTTPSQFSKIMNGQVQLSLIQLSNIARSLSMKEIDVLTFPDKYIKKIDGTNEPVEAVLQIKLNKTKKDQVLKLVFGENDIEILNR